MADHLLYYPYINLPAGPWTMRSLLYYNTISAIVPGDFIYDHRRFDPFMRTLVEEHLVIPLDPTRVLERLWELEQPFMDFINSPSFKLEERRDAFRYRISTSSYSVPSRSFVSRSKLDSIGGKPALISREKFSYGLMDRIKEIGLARAAHDNFYEVENKTAEFLMAYLSNLIARKLDLLPVTNSKAKLTGKLSYRGWIIDEQVNNRRNKVLDGVMPIPSELNLPRFLDFKYNYQTELSLFKNIVEQVAFDERYNDEALLQLKIEELNYHKEQLIGLMNKRRLGNIAFFNVCGFIGAGIGIATTGSLAGALLGLPQFANSIYAASQIESPESVQDVTGMKYLALLDKRLVRA